MPLTRPDLRIDDATSLAALDRRARRRAAACSPIPAQSNYSGVRHPLDWIDAAQERGWDVLLDASAFVPTNRLDLSRGTPTSSPSPGTRSSAIPTGIGSLLVRREALARLRRPWFAGGTIGVASVARAGHTLGDGHGGFEDGTIDYLGLPGDRDRAPTLESVGIAVDPPAGPVLTRCCWASSPGSATPTAPRRSACTVRRRRSTAAARSRSTCSTATADRRLPGRRGGAPRRHLDPRPGASATRARARPPRHHRSRDGTASSRSDRRRSIDELRALLPGRALGAVRVSVGIATTDATSSASSTSCGRSPPVAADGRRARLNPAATRTVLPSGSSTSAHLRVELVRNGARRPTQPAADELFVLRRPPFRCRRRRTPGMSRAPPLGGRRSGSLRTNVVVKTIFGPPRPPDDIRPPLDAIGKVDPEPPIERDRARADPRPAARPS